MRPIYFGFALFAATPFTAAAQQNSLDCAVSAMTNYNKASLALAQKPLQLSVEKEIAERRLEEQYCLERAKCEMQAIDATQPWYQMVLATEFSDCLRDEAEEKLKHASPRPKKKNRDDRCAGRAGEA